ncbi:hypothetical protein N9M16_01900 [Candidatus Dependentiae bacterium]|nr:hypothetical protein [Candidatus Dependentiae bacterium]
MNLELLGCRWRPDEAAEAVAVALERIAFVLKIKISYHLSPALYGRWQISRSSVIKKSKATPSITIYKMPHETCGVYAGVVRKARSAFERIISGSPNIICALNNSLF